MIKITIDNPNAVEQEYIEAIISPLVKKITCAKKALDYLRGELPEINKGEIVTITLATITIIKKIDSNIKNTSGNTFTKSDFTKAKYVASINYYRNKTNNLNQVQLTRVSNLFNQLLTNEARELKGLLKVKPNSLRTFFQLYFAKYNLIIPDDLFYLKLAFNYEKHSEITKLVKIFYRTKNFIKCCPYCNLDKVEHIENSQGQVAARHDLDHFYDKATFPLLCYSMYNLVPSDTTCNQTNKGTIEFTDDYHLNPYNEGFNNSMVFQAVLSGDTKHRYKVELKSNEAIDSVRYRKIFGKHGEANNLNFGNVNAFKLNTRYESEKEHVSIIESKMKIYDKYAWESIKKYIKPLDKNKIEDAYKNYYKEQFFTAFDKKSLGDYKFGKLNRDIHDQYFNLMFGNKSSIKKKIEDIIFNKK